MNPTLEFGQLSGMNKLQFAAWGLCILIVGFAAGWFFNPENEGLPWGRGKNFGAGASSNAGEKAITLLEGDAGATVDGADIPANFTQKKILDLAQELKRSGSLSFYTGDQLKVGRQLVRADAILAKADSSDLRLFMETAKDNNFPIPIQNLVYRRWASIAPKEAASFWLKQHKPNEEAIAVASTDIGGLMMSWVKKDKENALAWVESIENETVKNYAKQTLILTLSTTDAEGALDLLLNQKTSAVTGEAAGSIARNLPQHRLREVASRILENNEDGWQRQYELRSFIHAWNELDADAAFDWIIEQEDGKLEGKIVPIAIRSLAAENPQKAADKLIPHLGRGESFAKAGAEVWVQWILSGEDEEGAIEWLRQHGENLQTPEYYRYRGLSGFSEERMGHALELAADLPETPMKRGFVRGLLGQLSESDPEAALDFIVENVPTGEDGDDLIQSAVADWASKGEPEKAIQWALTNMKKGNGRSTAVRFAVSRWAQKDPTAAANYALTIPGESERNDSLWGVALDWPKKDPASGLAFIRNAAEPEKISSLNKRFFWEYTEVKSPSALLPEAMSMPPGKLRHDAVYGVFGGWGFRDAEGAALALREMDEGALKDAGIRGFVSWVSRNDKEAALTWSTAISNPNDRRRNIMNYGRSWLRSDRKAAEQWITQSTEIPAGMKTELLQKKN